jgi:hypothetical protein
MVLLLVPGFVPIRIKQNQSITQKTRMAETVERKEEKDKRGEERRGAIGRQEIKEERGGIPNQI